MSTLIATLVTVAFIGVLLLLARDREAKVSPALWVAVLWILIGSTRNVSEWLQVGPSGDAVDRYMEGNPLDRNILTVLIAIGCVVLFARRRQVIGILRRNSLPLVYFVFCGLSVLWSLYPLIASKRWLRGLGDLIMVLVIATDTSLPAALSQVTKRVSALVLPLSVLLIRYFPDMGRDYGLDGTRFARGVAGGKNGLGALCLVFGIAALWQFLRAWRTQQGAVRRRRIIAHGSLLVLAAYLLYISDSKTSLACFVLVGGLMAATMTTSLAHHARLLRGLVLSVIVCCAAVLFLGYGSGALEAMGRDPTLTGRTEVWKLVLRFADNPLAGAGYESFWMGKRLAEITAINGGINQAHNGYIEIYLNLGWVGVSFMTAMLLSSLVSASSRMRATDGLSAVRLAYIMIAVIFNFTEAAFKMMSPIWIFFLLSSLSLPSPITVPVRVTELTKRRTVAARPRLTPGAVHS